MPDLDFARLETIDIQRLTEDEANLWCEQIVKYQPSDHESRTQLVTLFDFTRSLLRVKSIQTDVLIEELQTLGERLDHLEHELDQSSGAKESTTTVTAIDEDEEDTTNAAAASEKILRLQASLDTKDDQLVEERQIRRKLEDTIRAKEREIGTLRVELETAQYEIRELRTANVQSTTAVDTTTTTTTSDDRSSISPTSAAAASSESIAVVDQPSHRSRATKVVIEEKNEQIEQLLDRLYESDRINVNLGEQLAKQRLTQAKVENDLRIGEAKVAMLETQVEEFRHLNESLVNECDRKEKDIRALRQRLEQIIRSGSGRKLSIDDDHQRSSASSPNQNDQQLAPNNFYHQLSSELKRLNVLIEVKDAEIEELRNALADASKGERTALEQRRAEIERLEQELTIVAASTTTTNGDDHHHSTTSTSLESALVTQLRKRNRKLRKEKLSLLQRINELEQEAAMKDETLERQRRRTMALMIDGGESDASGGNGKTAHATTIGYGPMKQLLEENAVLSRMIKFRDEKIQNLIDQLNRYQLNILDDHQDTIVTDAQQHKPLNGSTDATKPPPPQPPPSSSVKEQINLMDQLIAITIERDVLQKQLDTQQTHLHAVQNENFALQLGMKEILDGIRQGDANSDLVIECPSLERLCVLMENRMILPNEFTFNGGDSGSDGTIQRSTMMIGGGGGGGGGSGGEMDTTKVIMFKSELDFVRGQNEQLRIELKQLRGDFLAIIDEYTNDILENWTLSSSGSGGGGVSAATTTTSTATSTEDNTTTIKTTVPSARPSPSSMIKDDDQTDQKSAKQHNKKATQKITRKNQIKKRKRKNLIQHNRNQNKFIRWKHWLMWKKQLSSQATSHHQAAAATSQTTEKVYTQSDVDQLLLLNANSSSSSPRILQKIDQATQTDKYRKVDDHRGDVDNEDASSITSSSSSSSSSSSYVEMFDIGIQVNIEQKQTATKLDTAITEYETKSTQTIRMNIDEEGYRSRSTQQPQPLPSQFESKNECKDCVKYHTTISSIRSLIQHERHQRLLQEEKLRQQLSTLNGTLAFVQQEYRHDLDARNEEIRDLRHKLSSRLLSTPSASLDHHNHHHLPLTTTTNVAPIIDNIVPQSSLPPAPPSSPPAPESESASTNVQTITRTSSSTMAILETIISALQSCLQQKDQALQEYEVMMNEMRERYSQMLLSISSISTPTPISIPTASISTTTTVAPPSTPTTTSISGVKTTIIPGSSSSSPTKSILTSKQSPQPQPQSQQSSSSLPPPLLAPSSNSIETLYNQVVQQQQQDQDQLQLQPSSSSTQQQQQQLLQKILQQTFVEMKQIRQQTYVQVQTLQDKLHASEKKNLDLHQQAKKFMEKNQQQMKKLAQDERNKFEQKEKSYQTKIGLLERNVHLLNERLKRVTSASTSAATVSTTKQSSSAEQQQQQKKKVDNSVFQECANLRAQIVSLQAEVKRLELERWNWQKRYTTECNNGKQRLVEKEKQISMLTDANVKLHQLVARLEKQHQQQRTQPIVIGDGSHSAGTVPARQPKQMLHKSTQTITSTQSDTIKVVRFVEQLRKNDNDKDDDGNDGNDDEQNLYKRSKLNVVRKSTSRSPPTPSSPPSPLPPSSSNIAHVQVEMIKSNETLFKNVHHRSPLSLSSSMIEDDETKKKNKKTNKNKNAKSKINDQKVDQFNTWKMMLDDVDADADADAANDTDDDLLLFRQKWSNINEATVETANSNKKLRKLVQQYFHINMQLRHQLEQCLRREKLSAMVREVAVVGSEILQSTRIYANDGNGGGNSGGGGGGNIMSAGEVYDQLIDMQFERLISENAQLKVKLSMAKMAITQYTNTNTTPSSSSSRNSRNSSNGSIDTSSCLLPQTFLMITDGGVGMGDGDGVA